MNALVALDAGTGGGKCVIFDEHGRRLGSHTERWSYHVECEPGLRFMAHMDFDAEEFWQILCRCAREALAASGVSPSDVVGVATTSQREGCVFLDAHGKELYAGPNLDSRGFQHGLNVLGTIGPERLHQITGHTAPFIFPISRYLWFRENDTREVARLLMLNDWMTYRLSGELTAEPSNATESMLFDFQRGEWSAELLDTFSIPRSILPEVRPSGARVGAITATAARATGLLEGTPVYSGGADTQCALLGAGAVTPGDTVAILGTTTPVQAITATPLLDPRVNLWSGCHVVPDRFVIEANSGDTGAAYNWVINLVASGSPEPFARAERLGREAAAGTMYAFIGPSKFDVTAMRPDKPGGVLFPYPGLHMLPGPGDLVRSALESIGYAVRANLELIGAVTDLPARQLHVGGGMSRNTFLLEILADVTGLPVVCGDEPDSSALGCALLMSVGAGLHRDLAEAHAEMSRCHEIAPDAQRREAYDGHFRKWLELSTTLDGMSLAL